MNAAELVRFCAETCWGTFTLLPVSVSPSCGLHALNIPGVLFSIGEVQGQAADGYRNTQTPLRNSRLMLVATPQEEQNKNKSKIHLYLAKRSMIVPGRHFFLKEPWGATSLRVLLPVEAFVGSTILLFKTCSDHSF